MASLTLRPVLSRKSTPYILVVFLGAAAIAYSLYAGRDPMEKTRLAIRFTARAAFLPFIITYAASALTRLWPTPLTMGFMRNRFHWGTAYAIAMAIQFGAFTPLLFMPDNGEKAFPLYIGTINYLIIYGMALTPLKAAARAGNLVWTRRFHRVGMHLSWFAFFMMYAFYVTHGIRELSSVPLLLLSLAILGLRIAAWTKIRVKKHQSRTLQLSPGIPTSGI